MDVILAYIVALTLWLCVLAELCRSRAGSRVMQRVSSPNPGPGARRTQRAQVFATVLMTPSGKSTTEHMVYDLSTGGVRLCGVPLAELGDVVTLLLRLPSAEVRTEGRLLRTGDAGGRPDFAIQFLDLLASEEDVIHDAVLEALSHPGRCSVVLVQSERDPRWCGWAWLKPVLPICTTATTPIGAVQSLEEHAIKMGIVSSLPQAPEWIDCYPEISWRAIDEVGRLHLIETGLRSSGALAPSSKPSARGAVSGAGQRNSIARPGGRKKQRKRASSFHFCATADWLKLPLHLGIDGLTMQ